MNNKPKIYKMIKATVENTTPENRAMLVAIKMAHDNKTVVEHEPHTALFALKGKLDGVNIIIEYDDDCDTLKVIIPDDKRPVAKTLFYGLGELHDKLYRAVEDAYASQMLNRAFKHYFK